MMNQLTIRQIPQTVEQRLRSLAKRKHTSINKAAVTALAAGVGLGEGESRTKRDLSGLAGTWTEEQAREFADNTSVFGRIDNEVWK
jgi:plasmid stability protein